MVRFHMRLVTDALVELFIAQAALETLVVAVDPHVLGQISLPWKGLGANAAIEEFNPGVNNRMLF